MQHDAQPSGVLGKQGEGLAPGLAAVDADRLGGAPRQGELLDEHGALHVARCEVAVEVEPALADRDDARLGQQPLEAGAHDAVETDGVVGMHADRRVDAFDARGERRRDARRAQVGADRDDGIDAGRTSLGHGLVGRVLEHVEVAVGVDQSHERPRHGRGVGQATPATA